MDGLKVYRNSLLVSRTDFIGLNNYVSNVFEWDGNKWEPFFDESYEGDIPLIMDVYKYKGKYFFGGSFHSVDGKPANNVAAFDGHRWSPLGTGVTAPFRATGIFGTSTHIKAMQEYKGDLYMGGFFLFAGGNPSSCIARWSNKRSPDKPTNDDDRLLPNQFYLSQNHPNPFNPTTQISFYLAQADHVKIEIFNINGRKVTTLTDRIYEAGGHTITWDASDYASGIYFYKLTTNHYTSSKKMVLLK